MSESVTEAGPSVQSSRGEHTQLPAADRLTGLIPGIGQAVEQAEQDAAQRWGRQTSTSAEVRRRHDSGETGQPTGAGEGGDSRPSGSPGAATPLEILPAALAAAARDPINLRASERLGLWSVVMHMSRTEQDRTGDQRPRDPEHHQPPTDVVQAGLHALRRVRPEDVHVPGEEPGAVRTALDQVSYQDMEHLLRSEQRQGPWLAAMRTALQESSPHPDTPPEQLWTRFPNADDPVQHYSPMELGMFYASAAGSTDPGAAVALGRIESALQERHAQMWESLQLGLMEDRAFFGNMDADNLDRSAKVLHHADNRPITETEEYLNRVVDRFGRHGASTHLQLQDAKWLGAAIHLGVPGAERAFDKAEQNWLRNNREHRDTHADHLKHDEARLAAGDTAVMPRVDALVSTLEDVRGTPRPVQTSHTESRHQENERAQGRREATLRGHQPGEAADARSVVGSRPNTRLGELAGASRTNGGIVRVVDTRKRAGPDNQTVRDGRARTDEHRRRVRATPKGQQMDPRTAAGQSVRRFRAFTRRDQQAAVNRLTAGVRFAATRGRQVQQSRHVQATARMTATTTTRASVRA